MSNTLVDNINEIGRQKKLYIIPENIKTGITVLGVSGALNPQKPEQTKTATPTTSSQTIEPDSGYALSSVTVNAVDNTIDSNISASNIKSGVTILGVQGTVVELAGETKSVIPTTSQQIITPTVAEGKNGLTEVTVGAVTSAIDANIVQANIRAGVTILGVQGNLEPDKPDQTKTCTPTTSQQVIEPDVGYELASVTVGAVDNTIDESIKSENIIDGVSILGVSGTSKSIVTNANQLPESARLYSTCILANDLYEPTLLNSIYMYKPIYNARETSDDTIQGYPTTSTFDTYSEMNFSTKSLLNTSTKVTNVQCTMNYNHTQGGNPEICLSFSNLVSADYGVKLHNVILTIMDSNGTYEDMTFNMGSYLYNASTYSIPTIDWSPSVTLTAEQVEQILLMDSFKVECDIAYEGDEAWTPTLFVNGVYGQEYADDAEVSERIMGTVGPVIANTVGPVLNDILDVEETIDLGGDPDEVEAVLDDILGGES